MKRIRMLLIGAFAWGGLMPTPVVAADIWPLNGAILFVRSDGCPLAEVAPRLRAAGQRIAADKRTRFVATTVASFPDDNVDMMGNTSPYIAGLEINAGAGDVGALAAKARELLAGKCQVDVFSVHERRIFTLPPRPLGQPARKTYSLLVRKAGTTPEFFTSEWAGPHAELVMRGRAARGPTTEAFGPYIHNYVLARSPDALPFDGIAEEPAAKLRPTPESIKAARAAASAPPSEMVRHATVFLNLSRIRMFTVDETVLKQ
jgi:hypothetical protein